MHTMIFHRSLNLSSLLNKKSFFLFGPRATGKSFLIKQQLKGKALIINLLDTQVYLQLNAAPYDLESLIDAHSSFDYVVIDEVQKVPLLLDEVHRLIEERQIVFLLTGSSARKLKNSQVNLLAGRAWEARLFPLTHHEIPGFDLTRYLQVGGLPAVYSSKYPAEELKAYVRTYLIEEIQAEALVRKVQMFTRFLPFAAMNSGNILNFSKLASDTSVPASTIREYYQILEDTFLGFMLPAVANTTKRKAYSTGKFYLFDLGVRNTLTNITHIPEQSDLYGQAFEHLIILEIRAYLSYRRIDKTLSYWQSTSGFEVDIIIGNDVAIETKSAKEVRTRHFKTLRLFSEENLVTRYILVSRDKLKQKQDGIEAMPWEEFFTQLWAGEIV
jgi:uncharacterized protein